MSKINELKDKTIMDRFSLYFCFLNLHKDRLNSPVYYPYELQKDVECFFVSNISILWYNINKGGGAYARNCSTTSRGREI